MRYTKAFKEFLDLMERSHGVQPFDFSHHVIVSYILQGSIERFAFVYANPDKSWTVLNVYPSLDLAELGVMKASIDLELIDYLQKNPLPDPEIPLAIEPGNVLAEFREGNFSKENADPEGEVFSYSNDDKSHFNRISGEVIE